MRFVLTVGDNIYASVNLGYMTRGSGSEDRDWDTKFFQPYREVLEQIPFLPSLGNHDGNASENRGRPDVYTWTISSFRRTGRRGGTSSITAGWRISSPSTARTIRPPGHPTPIYRARTASSRAGWRRRWRRRRRAWKIPYFHHPPFNAGPGHGASYGVLRHWVELFQKSGVKVVFTGHEHN